jgi:uncharacterized protein YkwD
VGRNATQTSLRLSRRARSRLGLRLAGFGVVVGIALTVALAGARGASAHAWYAGVRTACADSPTKMLCYHDVTRRRAGLQGFARERQLDLAAALKGDRIVRCKELSHHPCGDSLFRPFYQAGYLPWSDSWLVGENLAWGWPSAWDAFHALMHSESHRDNILNPAFGQIGIERRPSPWGRLWVIHFGRRW